MRKTIISGTLLLACASWCDAASNSFVQHNLVSDLPGMADHLDPCLINPWGIVATPTSPFWISLNGTGLSGIYDGNGNPNNLVVSVPGPAGTTAPAQQCRAAFGPGAPSGIIVNDTTAFLLGGAPASFIFSSEQGVIAGWNGAAGKTAAIMADRSAAGAVYKGLATATRSEGPLLYAADFGNGRVDVFDGQMNLLSLPGAFTDPGIPAGFAPFNIANLGGSLYVTYAKQNAEHHDDVAGAENGYIDVFDLNGIFLQRLVSAGPLNSPWGMVVAPATFGSFGGALLVGNFGDGAINAFDPVSGMFLGALQDGTGAVIHISGLWGLFFGNGSRATPGATPSGGDANSLYFAAGIAGPDTVESHGLLGSIQVSPAIAASVVNAASFQAPIAPGGFATIFGSGLAATTRSWAAADFVNSKLPVQLDGVSVTINGKAAYVYYVSPSQIDVIAPADSTTGPVPVVVTTSGAASPSATAVLQNAAPAFFAIGKYVVATHINGSLVGPASVLPGATPAVPGEVIVVYGTGFGPTNPAVDGLVATSSANLAITPNVSFGGTPATSIPFAGLGGPGLDQLNVTVPALPAGSTGTIDLSITATVGASGTQPGLMVTVQPGK